MNVFIATNTEDNRYWVHMDSWQVRFSTLAEAQQFVDRLNARLNARHSPHMLASWSAHTGVTGQADKQWAREA
ncbi:hypothetical protein GEV39_13440 [Pseudomonas sp. NY5710]|uniref:hypothetical protein n=1 Tax=Pseudomonas sp. NY5710 TaxID=2662033 RepID=UPI00156D60F4|nr:hypothetical protein [Pseudomonas sp. NY5710]QKL02330.1 hypothetical protein GEV39_13440 [Pseudomonas sp. NY5710]